MSRIAIDAALGSGFGLIRRQPGAVLLWVVVYVAFAAMNFTVLASFDIPFFQSLAANARLGTEAYTQAINATVPQMMAMQGWSWLMSLVSLMVSTILYCAAFRAVLHPEQTRFGYLRVGTIELLLFVLVIAAYIVLVVATVVAAVVIGLLAGLLAALHAVAAAVVLGVLAAVVGGILLAAAVADLSSLGGGLAHLSSFFAQPPSTVASAMAPFLVFAVAILTPLIGCAIAVGGAPWARAYLDLTRPEQAVA